MDFSKGKTGTVAGARPSKTAKPPACVLFKQDKSTTSVFEGLAPATVPVFPLENTRGRFGAQDIQVVNFIEFG
jgi:hypothetical protein